ncbi:hypothetical protein CYJ40_10400 [Brevibacterium ravenspurgense]|uniref:Uncharacterized protein n=1 Tax=Brevibacterium ravenspurgense TaxID=479117 RepID=A0A2I1IEI7_9MICO|nr:hypothetical protein [Brevibacterium ravenspurgense]PKY69530.1 hypothetical protein CYJ40_10400 [Brevibacterium ravenspurgense]
MGFFDALLGRSKPVKPNLDALFGLPPAALTLEAATDYAPTGVASVAYRAVEGGASADAVREASALIAKDADLQVRTEDDSYGYSWHVLSNQARDIPGLVTNLHAVNSSIENAGFGPMLLCSSLYFSTPSGTRAALVYLYKRGTFYPFVQTGPRRRDNAEEFNIKAAIGADLRFEEDTSKWSPLWDAPGMLD